MRRVLAAVAAMLALGAAQVSAQAIITNGTIGLGVDATGQLNIPGPAAHWPLAGGDNYGLRYLPTNGEATADGCPCEGWGAGYDGFGGGADNAAYNSVGFVSFSSTASSAYTVGMIGGLQITHDFHAIGSTANLFEVTVTLTNLSGAGMGDVRYRRLMDWDIEPTPFNEVVELAGFGSAANLVQMSDNGFNGPSPYDAGGGILSYNTNGITGPADHGALFDFDFGALANGASVSFNIYYGAGANYAEALHALGVVGAEAYSIAWCDPSYSYVGAAAECHGKDGPNVFAFGFTGIGGPAIVSPEPATYALMGTGLLGVLALRRRRRA